MDIIWGTLAWLFWVGFCGFNFVLWGGLTFQWMMGSPDLSEQKEYPERYWIVGIISGILGTRIMFGGGLIDIFYVEDNSTD